MLSVPSLFHSNPKDQNTHASEYPNAATSETMGSNPERDIWRSARLVYHAIESEDESFLLAIRADSAGFVYVVSPCKEIFLSATLTRLIETK